MCVECIARYSAAVYWDTLHVRTDAADVRGQCVDNVGAIVCACVCVRVFDDDLTTRGATTIHFPLSNVRCASGLQNGLQNGHETTHMKARTHVIPGACDNISAEQKDSATTY